MPVLSWDRSPFLSLAPRWGPGGSLPVASSTLVRLRVLRTDLGPRAARCHLSGPKDRRARRGKPRVVPDEDHEVVYERVAAVDVAKASGVACSEGP